MNWLRFFHLYKMSVLCLVLLSSGAHAADLITSRAFFEEGPTAMSLKQVELETFKPFGPILSRGYRKSATWIRIEITPPPQVAPTDDLVLRIRPSFLDEIQLFDPLDASGVLREVGDTKPIQNNEFKSLAHTFVIPAGKDKRYVYLRLRTTSTSFMSVEALTRDEMVDSELMLSLINFSQISVVAVFALIGFFAWLSNQEFLYAVFAARQIYLLVYAAALFGLHRLIFKFLPPAYLDAFYSWVVIGATAITYFFEWLFLQEYSPPRWARYALNAFLWWSGVVVILMLFGYVQQSLFANMLLNQCCVIGLLVVSLLFIDQKQIDASPNKTHLNKRVVVTYYAVMNTLLLFSLLPYLGLIEGTEFALNGMFLYALCSSIALIGLMQLRSNKRRQLQLEGEKRVLLSMQQVAFEKAKREEQAHLLHMLMHELKNPLAIIEMAQHANNDKAITDAYISRSVKNMKEVIDRCVRTDRLSEGNISMHIEELDLDEFICDCIAARDQDEREIEVRCDQTLHVKTDQQLFKVMLNNLLDNAIRYGDPLVPVELLASKNVNEQGVSGVVVAISNRPGAVAWPDPDKVFSKYYRGEAAKSKSGTGLGLYLVRTLARLVGGDCRYIPDDRFIKFELWLPS